MSELLPCPHCGCGAAMAPAVLFDSDKTGPLKMILCRGCQSTMTGNSESIIAAWNRRASSASQDKVVEGLREVWLVGGACGQYDEHREWVVGFLDTKEQAEAAEKHLEGKFKEYMEMRGDEWDIKKYEKADKFMRKHDPFHENNSDDTQYFAYKVDHLAVLARLTPGKEG